MSDSLSPAHLALARRLARRYHCPGHTAEDLQQEAVLVILKALPVHRPEMGPVEAYLNVCVRSHLSRLVAADRRRDAGRQPLDDMYADPEPGPAEQAQRNEALTAARRSAILRRVLGGDPLTAAERALKQRAVARLRRKFG